MNSSDLLAQIRPSSIINGYFRGVTRKLRDIPLIEQSGQAFEGREFGDNDKANKRVKGNVANTHAQSHDLGLQQHYSLLNTNLPLSAPLSFDGNGQADNTIAGAGNVYPPDPTMAVGPNHVVQMINLVHSVYNKAGTRLTGPLKFSAIATGSGATNSGDPFVLYDQLADRWLLMQFSNVFSSAGADRLIFCISQTNDPTGAYNIFSFNTPSGVGPDYPHVAIWPNAYLITTHEFNSPAGNTYLGQGFYAIDRKKMLQGPGTVNMIRFVDPAGGGYLPASMDGYKTPEPSSLPMFWTWDSDETGAPNDRLIMRTASLNFNTPALSTLSPVTIYPTSAFDGSSPISRSAIEQPGTSIGLDAIADRMMSRIIYRRFDNDESIVFNYTVNVSGITGSSAFNYQAAVRWGEMKRTTPAAAWTINQQATYSPDAGNGPLGYNRWMGSIGIDQKGGIAIGYTRSGGPSTPPTVGSDSFPSMFYAERNVCAPVSTLSAEQLFYKGSGSQTGTANRWGDYSGMAIDPSDETTFWFTHEYYSSTSLVTFKTRIGSFQVTPCPASPTVHFKFGGTLISEGLANTLVPGSACLKYKDTSIIIQIDQPPTQPVNITLTTTGTATLGSDYDLIYSPIVLTAASPSASVILRIYNDGVLENDEFVNIGFTINANGGNAVSGSYNQLHRVTIFDDESDPATLTTTTSYGSAVTVFNDNFDGISTGLGTWSERNVFLTSGATNPNHWFVGLKGGSDFINKSMYISDNADTIHYSIISGGVNPKAQVRIESPLIDLTGKGQAALTFTYKCNGEPPSYDFGSLWYSIDGGSNWTTFGSMLSYVTTATTITVNLPAGVENVSHLRLGFQWESDYSIVNQPPFGIDNVSLTAKPVTIISPIQAALNPGTAPLIEFGPNQVINYIDPVTNKIMATLINNSSFDWGCTKVEVDRSGTGAVNFNSVNPVYKLASKTFKVTPTNNNLSASYTIRLYYTEAESRRACNRPAPSARCSRCRWCRPRRSCFRH